MRRKITTALALSFMLATAAAAEPPPARKPPAKVTFHKAPSEESAAAREKRLKRECKGRPNAGACLGHTSR
ncbi:MAG: hypothetical protein IBJ14_15665 [Hydrogenophaga sp.]|nr:hypothetical protein [Hydrogenophaga sp.]